MRPAIWWIARKELWHMMRDPMVMRLVFLAPLIELVMVGYAITMDVELVPCAICDEDHTRASQQLVQKIDASPRFQLVSGPAQHGQVKQLLDRRRAKLVVVIPRGFQDALLSGRTAQISLVLDGSDATTARVALAYLQGMIAEENVRIINWRIRRSGRTQTLPLFEMRPAIWFNPELKSRDYMIPGLVGLIVLMLAFNLSTLAIVREREMGSLERLIMAPISPAELAAGKLLPYFGLGLIEAVLVLGLAKLWFNIPIRGSVLFVYAAIVIFTLCNLGLGLFVSAIVRTQQQAMLTNVFVIMPSILMSGFIAPIRNMTPVIRELTYLIPLRHFLEIVRGVCLKGLTPVEVWPQLAILLGLTVAALLGGMVALRRRL